MLITVTSWPAAINFSTKGVASFNFYNGTGLNFQVSDSGQNPTGGYWSSLYSGGPALRAVTPTNATAQIHTTGTGSLNLGTNAGVTQLSITNTNSAVNYLSITGAATLGAPLLSAQGSDTNVGLTIQSKGVGTANGVAILFNKSYSLGKSFVIFRLEEDRKSVV